MKQLITTKEGNKLIAEFMELHVEVRHGDVLYADWDGMHDVKYDESWDWLMDVVEKISNTAIKGHAPYNSDQFVRVEIVPGGYVKIENLRDTPIFRNVSIEKSLIKAVWSAALDFILWYNNVSSPIQSETEVSEG